MPAYIDMVAALGEHRFLRRIHTTDNSAIPYQLHAEVVCRIIEAQGNFYPWLKDAGTHILKVLTSRIPYYVGPLDSSTFPAMSAPSSHPGTTRSISTPMRPQRPSSGA